MFMNKILVHQHFLKGHLTTIIGVMLCLYFSYHTVFGHRSILTLTKLENKIELAVANNDDATQERQTLEAKVLAMRPDSINPDMLEERARSVLGYKRVDEVMVLGN